MIFDFSTQFFQLQPLENRGSNEEPQRSYGANSSGPGVIKNKWAKSNLDLVGKPPALATPPVKRVDFDVIAVEQLFTTREKQLVVEMPTASEQLICILCHVIQPTGPTSIPPSYQVLLACPGRDVTVGVAIEGNLLTSHISPVLSPATDDDIV